MDREGYKPFTELRTWEPCLNVSGEDIPPYSIVEVKCFIDNTYQVGKPSKDGVTSKIAVTARTLIPKDGAGLICFQFPNWIRFSLDGSDPSGSVSGSGPACGDSQSWGVMAGSFYAHRGQSGFQLISAELLSDLGDPDLKDQFGSSLIGSIPPASASSTGVALFCPDPLAGGTPLIQDFIIGICAYPDFGGSGSGSGSVGAG